MDTNGQQGYEPSSTEVFSQIRQALEIVHSPQSTNEARREAQDFLEKLKGTSRGPLFGHNLGSDRSQPHIVRHYGLSLLEYSIRYQWSEYGEAQKEALLRWVLELSQTIAQDDPSFLRNKTAQLWIEVAKRSWGAEWMDMDTRLVELWNVPDSPAHKEFVLSVLETLSDEVFTGDDPVVSFREGILSKACVEIFTPTSVLVEVFPNRQAGPEVRHGHEGWLTRIAEFLKLCISSGLRDSQTESCAVKCLATMQTQLPWAIPKAIIAADAVEVLCGGLAVQSADVQKGALEALHGMYGRINFNDTEFHDLVVPMYREWPVQLFKNLFEYSQVDPNDIDDDKYLVLKKLSELLASIGEYLARKFDEVPEGTDVDPFLHLLIQVAQHQSLMVSIPAVVTWGKLLNCKSVSKDRFTNMIGPLLEIATTRLVRYEHLPEDSEEPPLLFLMEDTDTMPERHAFLGNYRRFTCQLVEAIVRLRLADAVTHILSTTDQVLHNLYPPGEGLNKQNYDKHSQPALRVDCQFTVIEAMLKGFKAWKTANSDREAIGSIEANLEAWCNKLIEIQFDDPVIRKRCLQLLVYFSTTALSNQTDFMLKVLEHILMTWPNPEPEYKAFNEAVKDLQGESMVELQRLASEMPDHLIDVYDQISHRVNEMLASGVLDEKRTIAYKSFLFIIVHRTDKINVDAKIPRLREFIDPVKSQWQDTTIQSSLGSYPGFCELLGLDKAQAYLAKHRAHEIQDWGSCPLDSEGLAIQAELEERLKTLPLRATKSFLAFSVERLSRSSPAFQASHALWQDGFTTILADVLRFLSYAHASHNPQNWMGVPPDMRSMVDRVLSDRFWQSGISEGSKDDFYARVQDKKGTVEGFASTVRGSVRFVRETAYSIIYCMSRLESLFYSDSQLAEPLAQSFFADSTWLSTHQQSHLLNLVRYLVDDCPVDCRQTFFPHLLEACFRQTDTKITGEWARMEEQKIISADGDSALKEEMKSESILRQVTYTATLMVADFLDPSKLNPRTLKPASEGEATVKYPTLRKFCLMNQQIVEPLLVFCAHGIRMKDTRCCSMILRLFVSLVPEFSSDPPGSKKAALPDVDNSPMSPEIASVIREYISTEVLQACITSFHEPYFVDLQKDLASLIASIVVHYGPLTTTPRNVILSLPNVKESDLERLGAYTAKPGSHTRQQRSIVLDMLKDLKGVSVAEMGKMVKSTGFGNSNRGRKPTRTKMAQAFMEAAAPAQGGNPLDSQPRGGTPDPLEGVSGLFDG
ncbi:armadillo-type protein [Emericellopsis atlantica]|uniref:Armadillo-type protein n=1 Tax=Emericellopsis atlantica TaxID=2614577 RepID=A0A9P7ZDN6_9HYPO|nr:armadillo-type protein [Emericellopsis atlantica]KAG9250164.1 armadillo-type protein [Emericellopsis atlantica]